MLTFTITVWEKAEHWVFEATIEAESLDAAWKAARRDFPKREYSIRDVRQIRR